MSLFYCPRCGGPKHRHQEFCTNCTEKYAKDPKHYCPKCGKFKHEEDLVCVTCAEEPYRYCPKCGNFKPLTYKYCEGDTCKRDRLIAEAEYLAEINKP